MQTSLPEDITVLLRAWESGSDQAAASLVPLLYQDLRRIAARQLRGERCNHTLQPTALLHEAFVRLIDQKRVHWKNRRHFFAVAAHLMRRILVDHARRRLRDKRGGGEVVVSLDEAMLVAGGPGLDVLALDEALDRLAEIDPVKAEVVQLHFFAGLSVAETAVALECSTATVTRHWQLARAWLFRELSPRSH
ncbi:MAG TPA: RNA polymerase subunit sigma-70 [Acidobacteria bacterium]|nr:RNA polymerase subunit sigma-70 [Acidobacteriota bacterium]